MAKVYISSTLLDLRDERKAVADWIVDAGHQPVHSYAPETAAVEVSCLEDVDHCDIYVLIIASRYGYTPPDRNPENLSITHLEYRRAKERGMPIVALLKKSAADTAALLANDSSRDERVEGFKAEVSRGSRPGRFSDNAELIGNLSAGIIRALDRLKVQALSQPELKAMFHKASGDLLSWRTTLPNDSWLDRPELALLGERIEKEVRSVTLLLGEPGSGKSALLARLAQQLEAANVPVLGIKLDYLPETIRNQDGLMDYLQFPASVVSCVTELARDQKVVVLLDQLDALADLVVQNSSRLRAPLELLRDLSEIDNAHMISSCRIFEHNHDPRLRNLRVETLSLELPEWKAVDEVLQRSGIVSAGWNETMREALRSPHVLDTFLRLVKKTEEAELLNGYQNMLETLWKQSVLSDASGKRRGLAVDLSERMGEREVLWLPLTIFEDRYATVVELVAEGILVEDSGRIGFRHQTLYEFIRAKTFLASHGRLTEVVLARQDSLRIRPQVWHALGYMRSVDRQLYLTELAALWNAGIRPHLRMLVIEFLGHLQEPEQAEVSLLIGNLDDPWYRPRILASVVGSSGWFKHLSHGVLPRLMCGSEEDVSSTLPILAGAIKSRPETVLRLVDEYWMANEDRDRYAWSVLERAEAVDSVLVDRLVRILDRTPVTSWEANHIASAVSVTHPKEAPRIMVAWLRNKWEAARTRESEVRLERGCREVLDSHELYDLPAIAVAAPKAFLDTVWPWFVDVLTSVSNEPHPFVVGYREQACFISDIDDDQGLRRERPILEALRDAVVAFAEQDEEGFVAFAQAYDGADVALVQRLLAKGMGRIAARRPNVVLEFLIADPRRMVLGSRTDSHLNTKELIRIVVPHLGDQEFARLQSSVIQWNRYRAWPEADAELKRNRMRWNREHRLRLLRALPRDRMTNEGRALFDEELRAFPHASDKDSSITGFNEVRSPVTAQQMQAADDEEILNLFSELTDEHGWDHPRKSLSGGAIQAGRELGKLAKENPERGAELVRKLKAGVNEIPVGCVLEALAEVGFSCTSLYSLIFELAGIGFSSSHFHGSASSAIEKVVDESCPLPEWAFGVMEGWLQPCEDVEEQEAEREPPGSILWGGSGTIVLPHGNYPILAALSEACLVHKPPLTDMWLDILDRHLEQRERSEVWAAMYPYLRWLSLADKNRSEKFVDNLLIRHTSILGRTEGILALAHWMHWAQPSLVHRWLGRMLDLGGVAAQGAGELLVLRRVLFPDEERTAESIRSLFKAGHSDAMSGIGFSLAHLWHEPEHRAVTHPYLLALFSANDQKVLTALGRVFSRGTLHPDAESAELLDTMIEHSSVLEHAIMESVGECLLSLATVEPRRVWLVSNKLLDTKQGAHVGGAWSAASLASDALVSIALALQDLGGEQRQHGTALFERLLEFNVPQARELLRDLDKRTHANHPATRMRRRRRLR